MVKKKLIIILLVILIIINWRNVKNKKEEKKLKKSKEIKNEIMAYKTKEVQFLFGRQYINSLKSDIKKAKEKIFIQMFLIKYRYSETNPIYRLIEEIKKAKERGVDIEVYLDNNIKDEDENDNANKIIYKELKKEGLKVKMDKSAKTYHSKVVIIDEEIIYCGSHNWTANAMNINDESSVRVKSKELAKYLVSKMKEEVKEFE
ncbi:MAG TPA: phospholipase D-like domain-containing protein [bacterium]|nr:phospholipase D-like domain-containing protein [bacterium]